MTGGYLVYASMTHQYIFDYKPKDVYWCTADIGWVTGQEYIIYGPLIIAQLQLCLKAYQIILIVLGGGK